MAGDCLNGWVFEGESCVPSQAVRESLPAYGPWVLGTFVLLLVLTLIVRRLARREQARESFALLKPGEKLSPEDLGFQVLGPGG